MWADRLRRPDRENGGLETKGLRTKVAMTVLGLNCESPKGASEHFGPSQVGNARWCFEEGRSAEWSHSPIFAPSSTDRLTSQPLPTTCLRPFPAAVRNGLGAHNKVLRCSARETGALQRRLTSVLYLGPSNFSFPPTRIGTRSSSGSIHAPLRDRVDL